MPGDMGINSDKELASELLNGQLGVRFVAFAFSVVVAALVSLALIHLRSRLKGRVIDRLRETEASYIAGTNLRRDYIRDYNKRHKHLSLYSGADADVAAGREPTVATISADDGGGDSSSRSDSGRDSGRDSDGDIRASVRAGDQARSVMDREASRNAYHLLELDTVLAMPSNEDGVAEESRDRCLNVFLWALVVAAALAVPMAWAAWYFMGSDEGKCRYDLTPKLATFTTGSLSLLCLVLATRTFLEVFRDTAQFLQKAKVRARAVTAILEFALADTSASDETTTERLREWWHLRETVVRGYFTVLYSFLSMPLAVTVGLVVCGFLYVVVQVIRFGIRNFFSVPNIAQMLVCTIALTVIAFAQLDAAIAIYHEQQKHRHVLQIRSAFPPGGNTHALCDKLAGVIAEYDTCATIFGIPVRPTVRSVFIGYIASAAASVVIAIFFDQFNRVA